MLGKLGAIPWRTRSHNVGVGGRQIEDPLFNRGQGLTDVKRPKLNS